MPSQVTTALGTPELDEKFDVLTKTELALWSLRAEADRAMYDVIGGTEDVVTRASLVRARRALREGRPASTVAAVAAIAGHRNAALLRLQRVEQHCARANEEWRRAVQSALDRERASLRGLLAQDDDFLSGLCMASRDMSHAAVAYRDGRSQSPGRQARTERGLLRYLTRASMKATPFSHFGIVFAGHVAELGQAGATHLQFHGDLLSRRRLVRPNRKLLRSIESRLRQADEATGKMRLAVNPSLRRDCDELVVLSHGKTDERVVRIRATSNVRRLIAALTETPGLTVTALLERASTMPGDAGCVTPSDRRSLASVVSRLISSDVFLRVPVIPFGVDSWWEYAAMHQKGECSVEVSSLIASLEMLDTSRQEVINSRGTERVAAMERARSVAQRIVTGDHREDRDAAALPLLEDVATEAVSRLTFSPRLRNVVGTLARYIAIVCPLAAPHGDMRHLYDVFDEACPDARGTPLLEAYERMVRTLHLRRARACNVAASSRTAVPPHELALERLRQVILASCMKAPDAEEVAVSLGAMQEVLEVDALPDSTGLASVTVFCEIVEAQDASRLVVANGAFGGGFGRYLSRFVDLLGAGILAELKTALGKAAQLVELPGDPFHNADAHPGLTEKRIEHPLHSTLDDANALSLHDLTIRRDPEGNRLLTLWEGQRQLVPIDLNFTAPHRRRGLGRVLGAFSPPTAFGIRLPRPGVVALGTESPEAAGTVRFGHLAVRRVVYRPRIVLDDHIVLFRRCWWLETSYAQGSRATATAEEMVRAWTALRVHFALPVELFVRVLPAPRVPSAVTSADHHENVAAASCTSVEMPASSQWHADGEQSLHTERRMPPNSRVPGDDDKPQYVHFQSVLHLSLLDSLVRQRDHAKLLLEERLPANDAQPDLIDGPHAAQLLLEFERSR